MKFITTPDDTAHVTVQQDGRDVNIYINEVLVAWFAGQRGCLTIAFLTEAEESKLEAAGVALSSSPAIKVTGAGQK